jgi:hypothetical protein
MTIGDFAEKVAEVSPIVDAALNLDWRFSVEGSGQTTELTYGEMPVNALVTYQAKSALGMNADITRLSSTLKSARSGDEDSLKRLTMIAGLFNGALANNRDIVSSHLIRTYADQSGRVHVGGFVSKQYSPLRHQDLVEAVLEAPAFKDARVVKFDVNQSHLSAMVLLDGTSWEVDGGLRAGITLRNGQFGDRSYGYTAMLFRLLCTNGAMDVHAKEGATGRHYGLIDVKSDVVSSLERTDALHSKVKAAMETEVDVMGSLIEFHRRKLMGRGPLREAADRRRDLGGGGEGGNDVWSLSQAVSAAARRYSFGQAEDLTKLSGRILMDGVDRIVASSPLPKDAPSKDEVIEYLQAV